MIYVVSSSCKKLLPIISANLKHILLQNQESVNKKNGIYLCKKREIKVQYQKQKWSYYYLTTSLCPPCKLKLKTKNFLYSKHLCNRYFIFYTLVHICTSLFTPTTPPLFNVISCCFWYILLCKNCLLSKLGARTLKMSSYV